MKLSRASSNPCTPESFFTFPLAGSNGICPTVGTEAAALIGTKTFASARILDGDGGFEESATVNAPGTKTSASARKDVGFLGLPTFAFGGDGPPSATCRTFCCFLKNLSELRMLTTFYVAKNDHQWVDFVSKNTCSAAAALARRNYVSSGFFPMHTKSLTCGQKL